MRPEVDMTYIAVAWHIRERSEGRIVGEPEELMEECNIVLLIVSVVRCALLQSVFHDRLLATLLVVALRHIATGRLLINHGHRLV